MKCVIYLYKKIAKLFATHTFLNISISKYLSFDLNIKICLNVKILFNSCDADFATPVWHLQAR